MTWRYSYLTVINFSPLCQILSSRVNHAPVSSSCTLAWRRRLPQHSMHCPPFHTGPHSILSDPVPRTCCRSLPVPSAGNPHCPGSARRMRARDFRLLDLASRRHHHHHHHHHQGSRSGRPRDRPPGPPSLRRFGTPFHHCTSRNFRSGWGQQPRHCTGNRFRWNTPGRPASSYDPTAQQAHMPPRPRARSRSHAVVPMSCPVRRHFAQRRARARQRG